MNREKIDLTISIVVFNNYEQVMETVESIERETSNKISKKVYLIDNSSSLNVFNLEELKKYNDVMVIKNDYNFGFAKAHNVVIPNLNSKYHAIVNPDISLNEDSFSKIIDFMVDDRIGMVIPKIVNVDGSQQYDYRQDITLLDVIIRVFNGKIFKKRYRYHTMQNYNYAKPFLVPFGQGSFLVIRTDLFRSLNGFDERFFMYLEDADLCKRVNQVSKLIYFPNTTVLHRWERKSHKNLRMFIIHLESLLKYFKKWGIKFL
ncbi:glycosyltransferase family 2 protein [Liquorilactobacillus hordei]|uniref:Glycosyl transferase family 2 n=1 Tax=Liquorilactobacillus hordei TaxID=468911 RepID=A0A3S6QX95_9LACO|nr:glycosyltransferase family 2 protein [Liquorilactobacillus hordei]AUJ30855.1 glycosyl transferase family 2 [Liquorilactobacillus hordei]